MRRILIGLFVLCFSLSSFAQTRGTKSVYLQINHKLGEEPFSRDLLVTADQAGGPVDYTLSRVEYYISDIRIEHDSGKILRLPNHYILVDANQTTIDSLGDLAVDQVEKITFSIGVDSASNHLDPATFPIGHPLYPRAPSMHWGWTAGYRFVAMEGQTGENRDQFFSIHALDDKNYFQQTQSVSLHELNGDHYIYLDADYTQMFNTIIVGPNLFLHGGIAEAITLLENYRDYVFAPGGVGIEEIASEELDLEVFPNPSNGELNISLKDQFSKNCTYRILDASSKEIMNGRLDQDQLNIHLKESGQYHLIIEKEGKVIASQKVLIN